MYPSDLFTFTYVFMQKVKKILVTVYNLIFFAETATTEKVFLWSAVLTLLEERQLNYQT